MSEQTNVMDSRIVELAGTSFEEESYSTLSHSCATESEVDLVELLHGLDE
jgi:hypothetical protein